MNQYIVEVTDLFGGELNYSYVSRFIIRANSERGAVWKLSRVMGLSFRKYYEGVYHSSSSLTGATIDYADNEDVTRYMENYSHVETL